ncbi:MAG: phosphoenolpyruvate synthase [Actinobacteria bacterium]|nr:phosphoenolpyruvate synthase [Actinomycetota bacterium]
MRYIKFFNQLSIKDVPQVGGKNASLGEMYRKLASKGVRVPNGFATTSAAYNYFLKKSGVKKEIKKILKGLDTHNVRDLMKRGAAVRQVILSAPLPKDLEEEIITAYHKLSTEYADLNIERFKDSKNPKSEIRNPKSGTDVAVRSSATAEDLPDASFAGQQDTYLNISGEEQLLDAVRRCIASLFTNRAISYRVDKKFDHFQIALSVGVQKMIRSDLASSGVMFSIDTESGFENAVLINSIYGLGENIVQGKVNPDEFYVFKPTKAIISKSIGKKRLRMVYSKDPKNPVKDVKVKPDEQSKQSITDKQVIKLAEWAMIIEKHYKRPMDIEWALDGKEDQLYIIQARPETIHSVRNYNILEEYKLEKRGKVITTGQSVGSKIGAGAANRIMDIKDIYKFKPGQALVTDMTDPDWEPIMKIASAIVTDKGGRTCHAAIVSRELGIPCIVGTENVSKKIKTGQKITVSCAEGETGFIYSGLLPFQINTTNISKLKKPKTKVMMNIGAPDMAFTSSFIPNEGVGLAREEFIINNSIKIHPLALINYKKQSKEVKKQIDDLTVGYDNKKQFYIDKLSEGVAMIAAAFYPKDVIIRLSDFKSHEYANLIGGRAYEPEEANPMIGWRGASRYYDPKYKPAFELECQALKKVRNEMGLKNLKIMIPFCRTVEEGREVKKIMAKHGLKRGKNGLEIYVMAEIPSNIILAHEFAKEFDGFSIGSNDLTQLTLGLDRDSGLMAQVAGTANEKNEAVKSLIRYLIEAGKATKTKVGICGQAPSDFPDFAQFLVELGIDSISLTPDTIIKNTIAINKKEEIMKKKR